MKRLFIVLLTICFLLPALSGCGIDTVGANNNNIENKTGTSIAPEVSRISVVTTIFPQYDFVREIAGDNVALTMLLPPGSESHSYEPTPQDIIRIQECDMFIYVGGESDDWVDRILDSMDTSNMEVIALLDLVDVVEEEIVEGMDADEDDDSHGDDAELDEHVWTSPKNAMQIVQALSDHLCALDTDNAPIYKENTTAYLSALDSLDKDFEETVANGNRKTIILGDRFPFRYFADAYGLDYYAAFPGCSTETEASAATVAFLIDKVREEEIPVVFFIEFSNEKMADTICESSNGKKLLLHSCHNITRDDFLNGITYLELMQQNAANLKEALA